MISSNASVRQWQRLHDRGYFSRHRLYHDWPTNGVMLAFLREYVGVYETDEVLEIGCGYGMQMCDVADHVSRIVGIDVHDAPLTKAREVLLRKANAEVVLTDGGALPFADESFSVVFSCSVFQHLPRAMVREYIAEARRVLKPDGRLCFQVVRHDPDAPGPDDIDLGVAREQSVAWTAEEFVEAARGVDLGVTTHSNHGQNLFLIGVAI